MSLLVVNSQSDTFSCGLPEKDGRLCVIFIDMGLFSSLFWIMAGTLVSELLWITGIRSQLVCEPVNSLFFTLLSVFSALLKCLFMLLIIPSGSLFASLFFLTTSSCFWSAIFSLSSFSICLLYFCTVSDNLMSISSSCLSWLSLVFSSSSLAFFLKWS